MTTLQAWILVGVPALVLTAGLFSGRSATRAAFGYLVLAGTFLFFLLVADSQVSAGVIGVIGVLLVASGRGDPQVEDQPSQPLVPQRVDDPEVDEPERV